MDLVDADTYTPSQLVTSQISLMSSTSPAAHQPQNYPWNSNLSSSDYSVTSPTSPSKTNDSGFQRSLSSQHLISTELFPLQNEEEIEFEELDDDVFTSDTCEDFQSDKNEQLTAVLVSGGVPVERSLYRRTRACSFPGSITEVFSAIPWSDICSVLFGHNIPYKYTPKRSIRITNNQMRFGDEVVRGHQDCLDNDLDDYHLAGEQSRSLYLDDSNQTFRALLTTSEPDLTLPDLILPGTNETGDFLNSTYSVNVELSMEHLIARRLALIGDEFDRQLFAKMKPVADSPDGGDSLARATLKSATRLWNYLVNTTTGSRHAWTTSRRRSRSTAD